MPVQISCTFVFQQADTSITFTQFPETWKVNHANSQYHMLSQTYM